MQDKGCKILERNYRSAYGEIDIIAQKDELLLFVEVKTRSEHFRYSAVSAVTHKKRMCIIKTALVYKSEHKYIAQPRFDVAEVYITKEGKAKIRYIPAAFFNESEFL